MYKHWTVAIAFCLLISYAVSLFAEDKEVGLSHQQIFAAWGTDEKMVDTQCQDGLRTKPCVNREEILNWLANSLNKAPNFLRSTNVFMLMFVENEKGQHIDGEAEASFHSIQVHSQIGEPIDLLMVHELAHLYHEKTNTSVAEAYLKIRYDSVWASVDNIWKHIREINPSSNQFTAKKDLKYDQKVADMIEAIPVPHRTPYDLHASEDPYEYWATSVELYYKYGRDQKSELKKHLSDKEISYLQNLFGY